MKTTKPNNNRIKNNRMYLLTFILSVLFTLNTTAKINNESDSLRNGLSSEQHKLEKLLFANVEELNNENLDISDIVVVEIEEEIELCFDTTNYLPENFNPLKGKHDLDWSTIELIEIEEAVEINFNTTKYLPVNFNVLKGKHDLDWSRIELIEMEEEIDLGFNTSKYLPKNFNPYMSIQKNVVAISMK